MEVLIKINRLTLFIVIMVTIISCNQTKKNKYRDWNVVLGDKGSSHYSSLNQINRENVNKLKVAWTYHTGDADTNGQSQIQCNPIIVNGILYATSPKLKVFALNAATGKEIWTFDPSANAQELNLNLNTNRGVTYWQHGKDKRIFFTAGTYLFAINALKGTLIKNFGNDGKVNLHTGLGQKAKNLYVAATSPGIIYKNLLIMGSRVSEGSDAAPGFIRAFDTKSGKLVWTFHTIPKPGEPGYHTWPPDITGILKGGVNNWAGMSLDQKRGILYVPLGSASPDFYGGLRKGKDLYANCLVALNAATGKKIWYYQTVHHDLWDRDLPAPPVLVTVKHKGKKVDAVAQTTKTGFVFLFNRVTGQSLFPIKETPVPTSPHLPGESPWPTQPEPQKPAPFVKQTFTKGAINPYVIRAVKDSLLKEWNHNDHPELFRPPDLKGQIFYPGFDGGAEWGGAAVDPNKATLYVNANQIPWILKMIQTKSNKKPGTLAAAGHQLYLTNCSVCHGANRKGSGDFPSLKKIKSKLSVTQITHMIKNGKGRMPGFSQLNNHQIKAIEAFLTNQKQKQSDQTQKEYTGKIPPNVPYTLAGYTKWYTPDGYPAGSPPWGTLTAIDLNQGKILWQDTLGDYPKLIEKGIPKTGTENYGGPVVTAGGLLIIAATRDSKIRAFDENNGKELWEAKLPAPGFATPSVYAVKGKEYLVIACGGGKLGTKSGDSYVAFRLPKDR